MESSKAISKKEYPDFLKEGAAKPRPLSKNRDILSQKCPKKTFFWKAGAA